MKTLAVLSLFAVAAMAADKPAPVRVAIYDGPGSAGKGIPRMTELLTGQPEFIVTKVKPAEVPTVTRDKFDVVIFTGGSGSGQSKAIGKAGVKQVHDFIESGGGYVGICAGAYLACSHFDWGTKILDAKTVSSKWARGMGNVQVELTPEGKQILGDYKGEFPVRYANGPILMPFGDEKTSDFKPLAYFITEISRKGSPVGVMTGAPAIAAGEKGKGRVMVISPHPEQTEGLDELVRNAVRWSGRLPPKPKS